MPNRVVRREGPGEAVVADNVRVMIVDAQPLVRSGMRVALGRAEGFEVIGEGASVAEAPGRAVEAQPDVVVLGIGSGLLSVRTARERWPKVAVLMVSAAVDPVSIRRAFERGVTGVLLPTVDDDEFVRALRLVAGGERYLTPEVGASLAQDVYDDRRVALSAREQSVLRLLALGHTNHEIARELVVSIRTVEGHRANLMAKLGLASRAELVQHALRIGLLDDELART